MLDADLSAVSVPDSHDVHARYSVPSLKLKLVNLAAVVVPFLGVIAAMIMLWGVAFNWIYLTVFLIMYIATGIGITVGYHRYFTHRSFKAPKPVAYTLAVLGSMAVEGPVLEWVATHRMHHQHSDDEADPHSPHQHGDTLGGMLRGFWHAHAGWLFSPTPRGLKRYVKDLRNDPVAVNTSKLFVFWVIVGLALPAIVAGLVTGSWMGVLLGFIWGGLARVFFVHHITWSINSVCHIWGSRTYQSHDESRNNVVFGVLGLGEGWHNNHHAFPTSARHGLTWWQIDISYIIIRAMAMVGLASDIRVPSEERLAAKRIKTN